MMQIDFINAKMNKQEVVVPQCLYKYRPFDIFTFDMLENGYVYLCPAKNLDDPSECKADISVKDYSDFESNAIKFKCIDLILRVIKPYSTEEIFQRVKDIVQNSTSPNGTIKIPLLLDASCDIQELVPEIDIAPLVNFLANIPEKLDDPNIKDQLNTLISLAYYARQMMGICSLSELKDSEEMWNNYADGKKGYCIEYDMRGYDNVDQLYPVVYQDDRETNIVKNMVESFIGQMMFKMSDEQIEVDRSQFMRMFLTKDLFWSYQKEWRLLGDAKEKLPAPKIRAIYLGKNMAVEDRQKMIGFCEKLNLKYII